MLESRSTDRRERSSVAVRQESQVYEGPSIDSLHSCVRERVKRVVDFLQSEERGVIRVRIDEMYDWPREPVLADKNEIYAARIGRRYYTLGSYRVRSSPQAREFYFVDFLPNSNPSYGTQSTVTQILGFIEDKAERIPRMTNCFYLR